MRYRSSGNRYTLWEFVSRDANTVRLRIVDSLDAASIGKEHEFEAKDFSKRFSETEDRPVFRTPAAVEGI